MTGDEVVAAVRARAWTGRRRCGRSGCSRTIEATA